MLHSNMDIRASEPVETPSYVATNDSATILSSTILEKDNQFESGKVMVMKSGKLITSVQSTEQTRQVVEDYPNVLDLISKKTGVLTNRGKNKSRSGERG